MIILFQAKYIICVDISTSTNIEVVSAICLYLMFLLIFFITDEEFVSCSIHLCLFQGANSGICIYFRCTLCVLMLKYYKFLHFINVRTHFP